MTDNHVIKFVERCLEKHQTQKDAEIKRFEKENYELMVKCIRAEAIKEFAEKLKNHSCSYDLPDYHSFEAVEIETIDQIAKEMGVEL